MGTRFLIPYVRKEINAVILGKIFSIKLHILFKREILGFKLSIPNFFPIKNDQLHFICKYFEEKRSG